MSSPPSRSTAIAALVCIALGMAATLWRFTPQAPQPVGSKGFSAEAAIEVLGRILADETPHPIGTPAQDAVRQRLMRELTEAGAEPEERRDFACSPLGACGWTNNIVVLLPGSRDGALMYSCHTDSAPSGPGASDDGAAVAIGVELVRHWVQTPHENSLIFLFDEGEETGLLGAVAFLERDPLAHRVAAVLNLEARGTAGISQMFETSADSSWMISAWIGHASYPFANSLSDLVYDTMPNYTDVTVWEWFGIPAANFALTENSQYYHTDMDTIENLDPSSLQSHGDNAWAMFEALGSVDLDHAPLGELMYFDVLGLVVPRWPAAWTPWLALGGFLLSAAAGWRGRKDLGLQSGFAAAGAWWLAILLSAAWAGGLVFTLQALSGQRDPWAAHGLPLAVGIGLGTLAIVGLIGALTKSVKNALTLTMAMLTAAFAVVLAVFVPAVAYLFAVPAAVAAVVSFSSPERGALAGLAVAVALWFPLLYALEVALGLDAAIALAAALALGLSFAIPLLAELPWQRVALVLPVAGLCAASTLLFPHYSDVVPERVYGQEVLSTGSEPVLENLALRASEDGWRLSGTLRSMRGASELILSIDERAGIDSLLLEASPVHDPQRDIAIVGVPPEGIRFEAVLVDPSVPWSFADRTRREDREKRPFTTVSWTGFEELVTGTAAPLPMAEASP